MSMQVTRMYISIESLVSDLRGFIESFEYLEQRRKTIGNVHERVDIVGYKREREREERAKKKDR